MKLYTKHGDQGQTQLVGGKRVHKNNQRVHTYGTIDELNSWLGYTRSLIRSDLPYTGLDQELFSLQHALFDYGTDLSTPPESLKAPRFTPEWTQWLEQRIDDYTEQSPPIQQFILPGGTSLSSALHYARTITRRIERELIELNHQEAVSKEMLAFMNRLSDYFFAAARWCNHQSQTTDVFYEPNFPVPK